LDGSQFAPAKSRQDRGTYCWSQSTERESGILIPGQKKIKHQVKKRGVILNSELNFKSHNRNVIKIAFYHLRNIAKVRPFLSQADTERLIHAFITSRLDYCHALQSGLPKKATG
jgi:hypothetical protein